MSTPAFDIGPYDIVKPEDREAVSLSDYTRQQWDDARRVSTMSARALNLSEAFDEVNDKIAKATGAKDLQNPLMGEAGLFQPVKRSEQAPAPNATGAQPLDIWKARVRELQTTHPDALPWDQIIDEPGRKALERMKSTREATAALDDRAGMAQAIQRPGLGWFDAIYSPSEQFIKNMIRRPDLAVAGLGAGFAASMLSAPDAAVNVIGAAWGGKGASLAKNAFFNAAANTIGQAPLSALKQPQYKEAGLPYGWDVWTREVAGAGVAGGLIDVSVRGPARAVKAITGRTEGMGGVFTDAPRAIPLPEQPRARPEIPTELLDRARADDLEAIKEVARLTGVDEDPAVKGAIHYAETTGPIDEAIAQRFREMGIDDGEGLRVLADALRGDRYVRPPEPVAAAEPRMRDEGVRLIIEREPELQTLITGLDQRLQQRIVDAVEAGIPRVVNMVQQRLDAAKGKDAAEARASLVADLDKVAEEMGGPERFAAMVDLYAGRGDIRTTAEAIRNFPDLVDDGLAGSGLIQGARAIAKLEPEAFERFRAGEVSPGVARVVSDMVPPDQQARVIEDLRRAGVETEADARGIVGDLVKPVRGASDADTPLSRGSKIDDPAGAEAAKQTEILANELADALKEAEAPIKAREKLETQMDAKLGEIAKLEEKAAKKAAKDEPAPIERYADPVSGMELSKGEVDSIVDMWSYVRETKQRKPESLVPFLISVGRIQDQSGELTNMLGGKSRHLISGKGMALDDAALKAYEAGFFTDRPDIATFLDAIRDDLGGNPRVREIDFNWLEDFREAQKMEQDLAELGVLKSKTEAEVRDGLRAKPEGEGAGRAEGRAEDTGRAEGEEQTLYALSDKDLTAIGEKHAEYRDLQAQHVEASRGSSLFALVMDRVQMQRRRDVDRALDAALKLAGKILPEDVKVEIRSDLMKDDVTGNTLFAGTYTTSGNIMLAKYAVNPAAYLGHEAVHSLVTRGLLSPEEVTLLAKAGRDAKLFGAEAEYRKAYEGKPNVDRLMDEEAAAHYIQAIVERRVSDGVPRNLIQKIQQIIERIRNALNGYGFRTETDVVRAIMEGDAAARRSVQAWMRSADMSAIAVRKPDLMYALKDGGEPGLRDKVQSKYRDWRYGDEPVTVEGQPWSGRTKGAASFNEAPRRMMPDNQNAAGTARDRLGVIEGGPDKAVPVADFANRMIAPAEGRSVTAEDLYDHYLKWVERTNDVMAPPVMSPTEFSKAMRERGLQSQLIAGRKRWIGITVKDDKPGGKLFALAGEKAQTANLDALAQARQYEAAGMDRDNIWKLTGWGRGADGKWRFEIDDSDAGFSARQSAKRESGQMGERFEHPELYDAYPALRALDLFWDRDMDPKVNLGGFKPDEGVVSLAATMPSQWTLPVLLHELQHGVQEMERFARGGSMAEFEVASARVQGWLTGEDAQFIKGTYFERDITMSAAKVIDGFDGGDLEQLRGQVMQLVERGDISLEAAARKISQQMQTDGYTRLAGEVEARLVETRMDMTPEQRRERPFWYDYDVLEMEQDVRRRDVMYAMADDRKLKAWHASENDIDTFAMGPRGRTAGGQEYPGASSFALRRGVSGPDGEWTKAVRAEFGVDPRVYEVEIDTGGLVLDVRKPFGQQSKEVQDYLNANAQRIRAEWPQNLDYMTFGGVPADMQKPEHYAAFLVNTKRGDRAAAAADVEQRLTDADSKKEKKLLMAVKSAIQKESDPEPDLFNQHTLSQLYGTGWSGGPKSPLEFGAIIGGDEVVVLDHSRVRIISKDGRPVEQGNMMFAMDAPRTPLHDDMEAISRLDAFKELVEACR